MSSESTGKSLASAGWAFWGVAPGVDFGQAGKRAVRFSYGWSEETSGKPHGGSGSAWGRGDREVQGELPFRRVPPAADAREVRLRKRSHVRPSGLGSGRKLGSDPSTVVGRKEMVPIQSGNRMKNLKNRSRKFG